MFISNTRRVVSYRVVYHHTTAVLCIVQKVPQVLHHCARISDMGHVDRLMLLCGRSLRFSFCYCHFIYSHIVSITQRVKEEMGRGGVLGGSATTNCCCAVVLARVDGFIGDFRPY